MSDKLPIELALLSLHKLIVIYSIRYEEEQKMAPITGK